MNLYVLWPLLFISIVVCTSTGLIIEHCCYLLVSVSNTLALEFDKNTPISGEEAYPRDGTTDSSDFTCDEAGYLNYLSHWTTAQKGTSRDTASAEFQQRLEYFKDSCEKIHEWNLRDSMLIGILTSLSRLQLLLSDILVSRIPCLLSSCPTTTLISAI